MLEDLSDEQLLNLATSRGLTSSGELSQMSDDDLISLAESRGIGPARIGDSIGERVTGGAEAIASIGSSAVAETVGGLAGLGTTLATGDSSRGVDALNQARDFLTFEPRTNTGRAILQTISGGIQAADDFVGFTDKVDRASQATGEFVEDVTGSTQAGGVAAATVNTLPTAAGLAVGARRPQIEEVPPSFEEVPPQDIELPTQTFDEALDTLRTGTPEEIAVDARPDIEAQAASERLGVELGPESLATNPTFIEVTQALKSQPGSKLAAQELTAIEATGTRASDLVRELGGQADRSLFDSSLRTDITDSISGLQMRSNSIYQKVESTIPPATVVQPVSARSYLDEALENLGGNESLLSASERQLLALTKGNVTYTALDRIRRDVGQGFDKQGPFRTDDDRVLSNVYAALTRDQQRIADQFNVGQEYRLAASLVEQRKGIEASALTLFGRDLNRSIVPQIKNAAAALPKGDLGNFRRLMQAVPENRRGEAAVAVLDQLFTIGTRNSDSLGSGFATASKGLKKNPAVLDELFAHLPDGARQRFDDISAVTTTIFRAKSRENSSRTARDVLAALNEETFLRRLYEGGKQTATAEGVASAAGVPGGGSIVARNVRQRTVASEAADDLLASPALRKAINQVAQGDVARAEIELGKSAAFKEWLEVRPGAARQIAALGFFAWITGEQDG